MANTFVHATFIFGFDLAIAVPMEYQLVGTVQRWAAKQKAAGRTGSVVQHLDPETGLCEAVADADLVLTDTWLSMGCSRLRVAQNCVFAILYSYQRTDAPR